ncbi:hypothetical protein ABZ260_45835, partial [Streptosporangium sp. NPDC006013]|uniref:hypothetical protein n=1 Tax=Streptosporangium sp. NPDC006013 TaxID=3155596 RepID=UPI0033BE3F2E
NIDYALFSPLTSVDGTTGKAVNLVAESIESAASPSPRSTRRWPPEPRCGWWTRSRPASSSWRGRWPTVPTASSS